jgi:hypothetical protein
MKVETHQVARRSISYMWQFIEPFLSRILVGLLSPRPRIRTESHTLNIESGWRTHLYSLGSRSRRVTVDPKLAVIRIRDRWFWFYLKSRRIEFDWIEEILYTYQDLFGSNWISHSSQDLFTVGILLKNSERVTLFKLYGEGEFINNSIWADWTEWIDSVPGNLLPNRQEGMASQIVDLLSSITKKPVRGESS